MTGKILLAGLVAILPLQFGRHFWPEYSYVLGLKVDYLSIVLSFQTILLLFLAFFFRQKIYFFFKRKKNILLAFFFTLIACLNIFSADVWQAALYSWLRLIGLIFFGFLISQNSRFVLTILQKILPFWLISEAGMGLYQWGRQSSINGIFRYLGERSFNIFTPGIAKATFLNQVFLRPYGTFSHPNSLAGFILVSLILLSVKNKFSWIDRMAIFGGIILLGLCFSRTVWLAALLFCIFFVLAKIFSDKKNRKFGFSYFLSIGVILLTVLLFQSSTIEKSSYVYRGILINYSLTLIKENPFFGVGLNNFIISLAKSDLSWLMISFLQPVHNIFLLIGSETGLAGLFIFIIFLIFTLKRLFQVSSSSIKFQILASLLVILFTGLFDHYWLTLIQNRMLFALILGLAWSKPMLQ